MALNDLVLGIDIGGSGIKGAIVAVDTGHLTTDRHRLETPQPSTPEAMASTVLSLVQHFDWSGPIGVTFPGIVRRGRIHLTANIDDTWQGVNAEEVFSTATECPVTAVNDADAAGVAEAAHGAARGIAGVVLVLTFGTGIGSGMLLDGALVPNTELGHLQLDGYIDAEDWAAARVRKAEDLSWSKWGDRVNRYLQHVEMLFSPDLIVVGGGVSRKFDRYADRFQLPTPVVPAALRNNAGIVGAAAWAARTLS